MEVDKAHCTLEPKEEHTWSWVILSIVNVIDFRPLSLEEIIKYLKGFPWTLLSPPFHFHLLASTNGFDYFHWACRLDKSKQVFFLGKLYKVHVL